MHGIGECCALRVPGCQQCSSFSIVFAMNRSTSFTILHGMSLRRRLDTINTVAWKARGRFSTTQLASLSVQQLVDRSEQNMGCNGDLSDYAFSSHKTVGVVSESLYLLPASLMSAQTQDPC